MHPDPQTASRIFKKRLYNGIKKIFKRWPFAMIAITYFSMIIVAGMRLFSVIPEELTITARFIHSVYCLLFPPCAIVLSFVFLYLLGTPCGSGKIHARLYDAGIVNHAGLSPFLMNRELDPDRPEIMIYVFDPVNIAWYIWNEQKPKIEAALNATIAAVEYGSTMDDMYVYAAKAGARLPISIPWTPKYLPADSCCFALGVSLLGPVIIDISKIPHCLLAGITGSGKSNLLRLMLAQALQKGTYDITIIDFKGGVDYGPTWRTRCQMCYDTDTLIPLLTDIVAELNHRKELCFESAVSNIADYNAKTGNSLRGIIVSFDEFAEAVDITHCSSKEEKAKMLQIIGLTSTIARLGRFADIHLWASTQSPLVDVMPAQIRNNLEFRAVGKCDENLSRVVIGIPDAAKMISPSSQGRFMTKEGLLFQAYWFNDNLLL